MSEPDSKADSQPKTGSSATDNALLHSSKTQSVRRAGVSHRFRVGAMVRYAAVRSPLIRKLQNAGVSVDKYEIIRQLPNEGGGFQYRIRNKADGHERIVVEGEISPYDTL